MLKEFGYTNRLSSGYILSIVAFYLYKNPVVSAHDKTEIVRFVRNAQITSYFTTSLDGKLEVVAKILKGTSNFKEINEELEISKIQPLKISSDDVDRMIDLQYGNPAVLPVLQLLYPNLDYKNSTFHIDHIYPKSKFNKRNPELIEEYYGKANFLYNLQLLQGDENMSKKAKNPEIWLKECYLSDAAKIEEYKERNYIEKGFNLEWLEVECFDKKRSEKLLKKLKEIFIKN